MVVIKYLQKLEEQYYMSVFFCLYLMLHFNANKDFYICTVLHLIQESFDSFVV